MKLTKLICEKMNKEESNYLLRDIKSNEITDSEWVGLVLEQCTLEKRAFESITSQLCKLLDENQIDRSHIKSHRTVSDELFDCMMANNSGVCSDLFRKGKIPLPYSFRRTILKHMQ